MIQLCIRLSILSLSLSPPLLSHIYIFRVHLFSTRLFAPVNSIALFDYWHLHFTTRVHVISRAEQFKRTEKKKERRENSTRARFRICMNWSRTISYELDIYRFLYRKWEDRSLIKNRDEMRGLTSPFLYSLAYYVYSWYFVDFGGISFSLSRNVNPR